jgi:hypothetical protein
MSEMVVLGIIGFIVNILVIVTSVTWKLSHMETDLREYITKNRRELETELDQIRREFLADQNRTSREIGETFKAYREKLNLVELFVRDTFVAKDTFDKVLSSMSADVRGLGDKLEARLMRIESKMDQRELGERHHG